jgi:hypothetical protein
MHCDGNTQSIQYHDHYKGAISEINILIRNKICPWNPSGHLFLNLLGQE